MFRILTLKQKTPFDHAVCKEPSWTGSLEQCLSVGGERVTFMFATNLFTFNDTYSVQRIYSVCLIKWIRVMKR